MPDNRYTQILERIFAANYSAGNQSVRFLREEMESAANELGVRLPKNLGDVVYSFRFRNNLPASIQATAPTGKHWVIKLAGKAAYRFELQNEWTIQPNPGLLRIKVPDATPGIITRYALSDEQALLAVVRYNRLVDIFTGVTSYSLQNHLRTTVADLGQVEVDEVYVGLDRRGAHYVLPLQAKGGRDRLSSVQIEQDSALCAERFPKLICRPLGAQFLPDGGIVMMEFSITEDGVRLCQERHYTLVNQEALTTADLDLYRAMTLAP